MISFQNWVKLCFSISQAKINPCDCWCVFFFSSFFFFFFLFMLVRSEVVPWSNCIWDTTKTDTSQKTMLLSQWSSLANRCLRHDQSWSELPSSVLLSFLVKSHEPTGIGYACKSKYNLFLKLHMILWFPFFCFRDCY